MKSFKFFIKESTRSKPIDVLDALKLARSDFSDAFKLIEPMVLRGVYAQPDTYRFIDPSKFERTSANTSNEYTWLTDKASTWKDYPDRSKSLICTLKDDISTAESFGTVHIVIPKNGANFGVCSNNDFWFSFPVLKSLKTKVDNMDEFNVFMKNVLMFFTKHEQISDLFTAYGPRYRDAESFLKVLEIANENVKSDKYEKFLTDDLKHDLASVISGKQSLREFFESIIDPAKNGFNTSKYADLKQFSKREVWTDSDCLLINIDDLAAHAPGNYRVQEAFEVFKNLVLYR